MSDTIPHTYLIQFNAWAARNLGLHFPEGRWCELEEKLRQIAKHLRYTNAVECIRELIRTPPTRPVVETVASYMTTGETHFFREGDAFDLLRTHILPECVRRARDTGYRSLRMWSAGCCTGEEPYSMAITAYETLPNVAEWSLSIRGTDINPSFLETAATAVYRDWSFRNGLTRPMSHYFRTRADGLHQLVDPIRRLVDFDYLNLADDTYPAAINYTSALDVIMCRNVLMYFRENEVNRVINRFINCLVDGGWLILSASEPAFGKHPNLVRTRDFETNAFQKTATPSPALDYMELKPSAAPPRQAIPSLTSPCRDASPRTNTAPPGSDTLKESEPARPRSAVADAAAVREHVSRLYAQGDYRSAIQAASREPNLQLDAKTHRMLVECHANCGQFDKAIQQCKAAIEQETLQCEYYYILGILHEQANNVGDAIASQKKAVYLNQDFAMAHVALGNLYQKTGHHDGARKAYQNTLAILSHMNDDEPVAESNGFVAGSLSTFVLGLVNRLEMES